MNDPSVELIYARGLALQKYGDLETTLLSIFSALLHTTPDLAAIIFYRLNNARARLDILDRLKRKRIGQEYKEFWNSALAVQRKLDQERNEIVHWSTIAKYTTDGEDISLDDPPHEAVLVAPSFWDKDVATPEKTPEDLIRFSTRCSDLQRAFNVFHVLATKQHPDVAQSFRDICEQPYLDPLPDTHPLSRNYTAPESQPPPSPV